MTVQEMKKRIVGKTIHYMERHKYLASIPDEVLDINVSKLEFKPNFVWVSIPMDGVDGTDMRYCTLSREVIKNLAERGESIHEDKMWIIELKLIGKENSQ